MAPPLLLLLVVLAVLLLGSNSVQATIHTYQDESLPVDLLIYRHSGMFSVFDTPYLRKDGRAYIKVRLQFRRRNREYFGDPLVVQVSMFEASNFAKIGYTPPPVAGSESDGAHERRFCCSQELKDQGVCDELNTLIIKENEEESTYVHNVIFYPQFGEYEDEEEEGKAEVEDGETENVLLRQRFLATSKTTTTKKTKTVPQKATLPPKVKEEEVVEDEQEQSEEAEAVATKLQQDSEKGDEADLEDAVTGTVTMEKTFPIRSKGIYYLMFSSCNELTGEVLISGQTEWLNPYGYLPGELYGFMPFYAKMSVMNLIVAIAWFGLCMYHWRQLLMIQNCITAVLVLSMIEMSLRYFDFATFNKFGVRNIGLMLAASVFQTVKKTTSRLLVLVVALGYGIIRPTLGPSTTQKVALIGGAYFFFATVQHIVENLSHTVSITLSQYLLMLPVAALDLAFYYWIFRALTRVLMISVALSVGWSMYYLYVVLARIIQSQWESRWIYDGFWDIIYFAILVPIMLLWRPTMNSQQYEYSKVAGDDETEMFSVPETADKEEYGFHLKGSSAPTKTPAAAAATTPGGDKDVIDEMEDALNSMVDAKPVVAKKD